MNTIKGKNVIVELQISSLWYPVFCCKSMEFVQEQEIIEVTSVNSSFSREYDPGMTTSRLNVAGVTILDNTGGKVSITYLMQESIRRAVQSMRINLTDDDAGTLQIAFSALITSNTISRVYGAYSQSVTGFVITGTPVISEVIPPPETSCTEVQEPLYIDCVEGESSVQSDLLEAAGVDILCVERTGVGHDPVSGTPGNREFHFDAGTGVVSFDPTNVFNPGEVIYILYQK